MASKFFCLGNTMGIFDKGTYYPVENFDETKFREIIKDLISSRKFSSADLLLKKAIMKYLGVNQQVRYYQKRGITDSEFYMYWRKEILENKEFQNSSSVLKENAKEVYRKANKQRRKEHQYGAAFNARVKSSPITRHLN